MMKINNKVGAFDISFICITAPFNNMQTLNFKTQLMILPVLLLSNHNNYGGN